MRIDIHNHFAPVEYMEVLSGRQSYPNTVANAQGWVLNVDPIQSYQLQPGMHLMERRIEDMDAAGIDTHVVSIICPAGETGKDPGLNVDLAQAANEGLARVVRENPQRFVGMGSLPLLDPQQAVAEASRAVNELGMRAFMVTSNVAGKMLDDEDLMPVYERIQQLDVPIMIHPSWPLMASIEPLRDWRMVQVLGFLYDTTLAMMRLILSGTMERFPELKIILCHCGSTIPYLMGRINRGAGITGREWAGKATGLPADYFQRVYMDTVCYHPPAIMLAHGMSGPDKLLFGSDYPYGPMEPTVADVEGLPIPEHERTAILSENAKALLKL